MIHCTTYSYIRTADNLREYSVYLTCIPYEYTRTLIWLNTLYYTHIASTQELRFKSSMKSGLVTPLATPRSHIFLLDFLSKTDSLSTPTRANLFWSRWNGCGSGQPPESNHVTHRRCIHQRPSSRIWSWIRTMMNSGTSMNRCTVPNTYTSRSLARLLSSTDWKPDRPFKSTFSFKSIGRCSTNGTMLSMN